MEVTRLAGGPAVGALAAFLADPATMLHDLHRRHGPVVALKLQGLGRPRTYVSVGDLATVRSVMHDADAFASTGPYPVRGPPGSAQRRLRQGMEHSDGETLRLRRRLAAAALSRSHVEAIRPRLEEIIEEEVAGWPLGQAFDLPPLCKRLTRRLSLELLFGEPDEARGFAMATALETHLSASWSAEAIVLPLDLPFTAYGRVLRQADAVEAQFRAWIGRRRETSGGEDLLSRLLDYRDEAGRPFPDEELYGQLYFLYGASFETCAATLSWMLALVAQHPEATVGLVDDARALEAVAKETLRLVAPVPVVLRRVAVDQTLPGTDLDLRRGDHVLLASCVVNRDPASFPEPDAFRPERWRGAEPPDAAMMSFSTGAHACLGSWFALASLPATLRAVLRRGGIRLTPGRLDHHTRTTISPRRMGVTIQPGAAFAASAITGAATRLLPLAG